MTAGGRRARLLLGGCVVVAAALGVGAAAEGTLVYSRTPGEELHDPGDLARPVRISGTVVPGTLSQRGDATRFVLSGGGGNLRVTAVQAPSGAFRPGQQAVVEGRMGADHTFHADRVIAQHGNVYRARS